MMKWLIALFIILLFSLSNMASFADTIELTGKYDHASDWMQNDPQGNQVIKTAKEIEAWNRQMEEKNVGLVNLLSYPSLVSRDKVIKEMEAIKPSPSLLYKEGRPVTKDEWKTAYRNMNEASLPSNITPRYGVACQRVNLRLLPVKEGWFEEPEDTHYDDLQGTALDPAEGVLILGEDKTKNFYFVQAANYTGWADKNIIALADQRQFQHFTGSRSFMVATEPLVRLSTSGYTYLFQMGAKIPIRKGNPRRKELILPVWDKGRLKEIFCTISKDEKGFHEGYLPYTRNTITKQAFKFLGAVYGWGGLEDSVDCSSFVNDVFRVTGLQLPRDADQQEKAIGQTYFYGKGRAERKRLISQALPGTLLFSGDHVMLKIGNLPNGNPVVIHALSSYYTFNDGKQKHYIRRVVVTDLSFLNGNQKWMMDNVTSMGSII